MARTLLRILAMAAALAAAGYLVFGMGGPEAGDRVTVSSWGAYEEWHMWKEIAAYGASHPGETIRMEHWVGGSYTDKVKIRRASVPRRLDLLRPGSGFIMRRVS